MPRGLPTICQAVEYTVSLLEIMRASTSPPRKVENAETTPIKTKTNEVLLESADKINSLFESPNSQVTLPVSISALAKIPRISSITCAGISRMLS